MKIGVIGAGAMGSGIAQIAAQNGHEVVLSDQSEKALERSAQQLVKVLERLVEKGKVSAEDSATIAKRIKYTTSLDDHAVCGLVIEAIVEDIAIKKSVFAHLDEICAQDAILASNTSSLSISAIASSCSIPERVIGIHFFNPAPLMPLVEIIPAVQTSSDVRDRSFDLIKSWKKVPVLAKDTPGFIVNRVARPFYGEALRMYEEGIADFATIDHAMKEVGGFRMGPFELMDFIGNDVNYAVTESVFRAFYFDPRYRPSLTQKNYSDANWLGRKTGRGYYDYREGAVFPEPDRDMNKSALILERILVMLINEAADALYLGIASRDDIDLAMTKGVNYPKGLLAWADEFGIQKCVTKLDELQSFYHEDRYRCSPMLRKMASEGRKFFD